MRKAMALFAGIFLALTPFPKTLHAMDFTPPILIDHRCTDITQIPLAWIQSIQNNIKVQYGHQSHGVQLTTGLDMIEFGNSAYADTVGGSTLPAVPGSLCIDGSWALPDQYWSTAAGMNSTRNIFRGHPNINVSIFCWCSELNSASESYVQAYLDSMSKLESEFPSVTFVYMTGNAVATGAEGYNRHIRNEQIRQYCAANNKVLYDFADLDSWWFNPLTHAWERAAYLYSGTLVPMQHAQLVNPQCDICGHANRESCIQKGKAVWWLLASIAGHRQVLTGVDPTPNAGPSFELQQNFPNPFDGGTSIGFVLHGAGRVELQIFDVSGQLVTTVCNRHMDRGAHSLSWNGLDTHGRALPDGIYFYRLKGPDGSFATRKMIKLR